jgi:hypothetical protein
MDKAPLPLSLPRVLLLPSSRTGHHAPLPVPSSVTSCHQSRSHPHRLPILPLQRAPPPSPPTRLRQCCWVLSSIVRLPLPPRASASASLSSHVPPPSPLAPTRQCRSPAEAPWRFDNGWRDPTGEQQRRGQAAGEVRHAPPLSPCFFPSLRALGGGIRLVASCNESRSRVAGVVLGPGRRHVVCLAALGGPGSTVAAGRWGLRIFFPKILCRVSNIPHGTSSLSARQTTLGVDLFAEYLYAECMSPSSVTLGEAFAECFVACAECFQHLATSNFPVV